MNERKKETDNKKRTIQKEKSVSAIIVFVHVYTWNTIDENKLITII